MFLSKLQWNNKSKIALSFIVVVLSTLISLMTIRLSIQYFGVQVYAIFAIVVDLLAYLGLSNLGIPDAVVTAFANAYVKRERKSIIYKGLSLYIGVVLVLLLASLILYLHPNLILTLIGRVPDNLTSNVIKFVLITLIFFILRLPTAMYNQLITFLGYVHISRILDITLVMTTFIVLLFTVLNKGGLVQFALYNGVLLLVISLIAVVIFYYLLETQNYTLKQDFKHNSIRLRQLIKKSSFYFISSIAGLLIMSTDNLVISHNLGLPEVASYAIANKVVILSFTIMSRYLSVYIAMFPKYQDNLAYTVPMLNKLMLRFILLAGILALGVDLLLVPTIRIWTHDKVHLDHSLVTYFSLYILCCGVSQIPFYFMYYRGMIRKIALYALIEGVGNLILSLILVKLYKLNGVIIATLITHFLFSTLIFNYMVKNYFPEVFNPQIIRKIYVIASITAIIIILYAFLGTVQPNILII